MEDERIVQMYWDRCDRAITCSQEKYGSFCFGLSYGILENREDSEECVNDTWLRAWNSIPPQRPQLLAMYFAKIVRRLSFDRWRAEHAQKRGGGELTLVLEELSQCIPGETETEDLAIAGELAKTVQRFLESLPRRERDLFLRRYFFTETLEESGKRLGISAGHAGVILHRVRDKLRNALEKEGYL